MKLPLNCQLLIALCALLSWSVSSTDTLIVTQTPHVTVTEGDPVNIDCCWTGIFERVVVQWLNNQTRIENKTDIISINTSKGSLQNEARTCSTLTFTNISREDSDIYFCKVSVEIPSLIVAEGNGTVITVLDRESTDENTHENMKDNTADSVSSTDTIVVTQTPHVSVMEGDAVNITCSWTETFERVRVHWLKNQMELKNKIIILKYTSQGSLQKESCDCSTLTFTSITREDSDTYICKVTVEIPFFIEAKGNGTVITVLDRESTDENTKDNTADGSYQKNVLIFVLRCLPILSLVLTLLYFNYRLTKSHQDKTASPGKKEEDQSEEKRDEIETEAE
ncbi:carcinoembryonic antigen-related cell adhesion molecule 1 isoform X1 [Scomber scombrus]|uniref:Carcinoembryonic antigen-related cell adhesion molecule 1 isoform X1 n=1 Tax=Scomber scombrus TaxID=13677 RepID=A0AAV1P4R2_SCOSC